MKLNRRQVIATSIASLAASLPQLTATEGAPPRLKKAVKIGMVEGATMDARFALLKKVGFEGVEMDSPGLDDAGKAEAKAAAEKHGITIHGVVDSIHWNVRLSDPDEKVREKGYAGLVQAIQDAKYWGATTVLLVPGAVKDPKTENFWHVWQRSSEYVKRALSVAQENNVKIAIEVVWNNFLVTPDQLIAYIDQFESPWVGAYFDCSNMLKYGAPAAEWIRKLGPRMLKFDFKGYNIRNALDAKDPWKGFNVGIGEGDEDWPAVLAALADVGYTSWATAEVGGGGEDVLRDIATRMDKVLGLAPQ
jgi:L-ribulose-5-phosphate 3-epimerase